VGNVPGGWGVAVGGSEEEEGCGGAAKNVWGRGGCERAEGRSLSTLGGGLPLDREFV
jgi:hypothetical protein